MHLLLLFLGLQYFRSVSHCTFLSLCMAFVRFHSSLKSLMLFFAIFIILLHLVDQKKGFAAGFPFYSLAISTHRFSVCRFGFLFCLSLRLLLFIWNEKREKKCFLSCTHSHSFSFLFKMFSFQWIRLLADAQCTHTHRQLTHSSTFEKVALFFFSI